MVTDALHLDVAAYALGVLDPTELDGFEAHLATCERCADELESLLPLIEGLDGVDVEAMVRAPAPAATTASTSLRRSLPAAGAVHRKIRPTPRHGRLGPPLSGQRQRLVAAGVVLVLTAVASFVVGARWAAPGSPTAASQSGAPSAAAVSATDGTPGQGRALDATDPVTGVHARLLVATLPWGSQVDLSLSGVRGPLRCALVAVDGDVHSTVVGSWTVPRPGYGVPEHPDSLTVHAATAVPLDTTRRFEVRAYDSDEAGRTLVTIAV